MATSRIRQNYHADCEAAINKQINMELYASYVYQSMSFYYQRDDVALPGMAHFCKKSSDEEREHAEKLMKLQNNRGGRIVLTPIAAPAQQEWKNAQFGLESALDLEKKVNASLLAIHETASQRKDPHLTDFLESEFLDEQVKAIKELGDLLTKLQRAGPEKLGEYLFDKELDS